MSKRQPITADEAQAFLDARKGGDVSALLDDLRDPYLRPVAVRRLGELRATEAIPRIIPLLHASDAPLRRAAAHSLGQLMAREALGELQAMAVTDEDPAARAWALFAIGCAGLEHVDKGLLSLTSDSNEMVRQAAIGCLVASPSPDVAAIGSQLRDDASRGDRRAIDRVVKRIRDTASSQA